MDRSSKIFLVFVVVVIVILIVGWMYTPAACGDGVSIWWMYVALGGWLIIAMFALISVGIALGQR